MMKQYVAADCTCNKERSRQKVAPVLLMRTSSSHCDAGFPSMSAVHKSVVAWYSV